MPIPSLLHAPVILPLPFAESFPGQLFYFFLVILFDVSDFLLTVVSWDCFPLRVQPFRVNQHCHLLMCGVLALSEASQLEARVLHPFPRLPFTDEKIIDYHLLPSLSQLPEYGPSFPDSRHPTFHPI